MAVAECITEVGTATRNMPFGKICCSERTVSLHHLYFLAKAMGRIKLVSQIKKGQETASASSGTIGSTVPSASEIGEVFVGKTNSSQGSIAKTANVLLSVLPYNDEATLYGNFFPEGPMSVIHCLHEQKPPVFWQFMTMLDAYITVRKEEDPEFPEDRNMLEVVMQCKFVLPKHNQWMRIDIAYSKRGVLLSTVEVMQPQ